MATPPTSDKRVRLVQAALKLSYRHGFGKSTLADIAAAARVPPGNVYYYFKTKEEIAAAIVEERLESSRSLRRRWDTLGSAKERLIAAVQTTSDNSHTLAGGGCCVGTLCSELRKDGSALANKASLLLGEHLKWMEAQFRALGRKSDARDLAVHLLAALQGIAVLAHALRAPELVAAESKRLKDWIDAL